MSMTTWHALPIEESVERLESSWQGLTTEAAEHRLDEYGSNVLPESSRRSFAHILLNQFKDFMILVLIAAAVISGLVGEPQDAIAIVVILTLNAGVGAFQEVRAEHAVAALRKMSAPFARVLRDQGETKLPAAKLVPGDVVLLQAGDVVPADLRLLEAVDLETDESTLFTAGFLFLEHGAFDVGAQRVEVVSELLVDVVELTRILFLVRNLPVEPGHHGVNGDEDKHAEEKGTRGRISPQLANFTIRR